MKNFVQGALVFFFCMFLAAATASAQQIAVDLGTLDPHLATQLLQAKQQAAEKQEKAKAAETIVTVNQAKQWADIGENVAKAIAATAKALSIEVNDFVKTPVGKWTLFFIFWYILGETVWTTVIGSLIWLVLGLVIWHSFRIFHIPKTVEVDLGDGKKDKKLLVYEFKSNDARSLSASLHAAIFILLSIMMIIVIL